MSKYLLLLIWINNLVAGVIPHKFDYELSVATIFNNDAPWLKEWIEYHKIVGVDHFYLYNNGSTDNFEEVLKPYIKEGSVTLLDWEYGPEGGETYAWVHSTQIPCYNHAVKMTRLKTRWLAIIDTDEFLVPLEHDNMKDFLKKYEKQGAVFLNWVCYGTSNIWDIPSDKLMIETLVWRSHMDDECNKQGKTIMQPRHVTEVVMPHYCACQNKFPLTHTDGSNYNYAKTSCFSGAVINHYHTRTLTFFWNEKIPRKLRMDNMPVTPARLNAMLNVGNKVLDQNGPIQKYVPRLRKKVLSHKN